MYNVEEIIAVCFMNKIKVFLESILKKNEVIYKCFRFFVNEKNPVKGVMEVKIDNRWDSFPDPEKDELSSFAGRSKDIDKLSNWIVNSDGGSVLIRGFRGIGKSAFVYHAISKSRTLAQDIQKEILFIPVNFLQEFEQSSDSKLSEESEVLTRLILSLHQSKGEIDTKELFTLAISSKAEHKKEESSTKIFTMNLKQQIVWTVVITFFLFFAQPFLGDINPILNTKWLPLLPLLLPTINILYTWSNKKDEKTTHKFLLNNPNYLTLRLKEALEEYENNGYIPVFVLDELDKFFKKENNDNDAVIKIINKIIRQLKYLFTLSKARFIFIVHEEYPHWKELNQHGRPESSTYFNWDIFLSGMRLEDIEHYFDNIKRDRLGYEGKRLFKEFIYYISFESKRVFSEINQLLRDFIEYREGQPYLVIKDFKNYNSSNLNKMRMAVIEDVLDSVLDPEKGEEISFTQRNFYHKSYLILRKTAQDFMQNRFVVGHDLSTFSTNSLTTYYAALDSPDFTCVLTSEREVLQMQDKLRDFFIALQRSAFIENEDKEKRFFFKEENTKDTAIASELTFEDIDIGGLPNATQELPTESLEFKTSINNFKNVLQKLKVGLNENDEIRIATSVFRDDGVALLASTSLADRIIIENPKTHHLGEIRKIMTETPNLFKILDVDRINWLKNWISYNLPGSKSENVMVGNKQIGFKIIVANSIVFVFSQSYNRKLSSKIQSELKKALIIQLNTTRVNLNYGPSNRYLPSLNVTLDYENLDGAKHILGLITREIINKKAGVKTELLTGKEEPHFAELIDIKGKSEKSIIKDIKFSVKSQSSYWRVGVLLGQNSNDPYEPFGDTGYPLIHLHKDLNEDTIRLTTYSNGIHPPDVSGKELRISSDGVIDFHLTISSSNIIKLYVNRKSVYNTTIDLKYFNKAAILAWGDGNPGYIGVSIINYNYEEII